MVENGVNKDFSGEKLLRIGMFETVKARRESAVQ